MTILKPVQSSPGKDREMSLPVNFATQPSLLLNQRRAQNRGALPISNQCRVPAGKLIRSPRSQQVRSTTRRPPFRVIRSHPDRINRCLSAGPLNPLNLIAVSPENAGLIGILIQVLFGRPALEANASPEQLSSDLFRIVSAHQLLW